MKSFVIDQLRAIADAQAGVILAEQLRDAASRRTRHRLLTDGWLRPCAADSLTIGPADPTDWQRAVGAVLSCGPGAALSHSSAAAWELPHLAPTGDLEVSVEVPRHPRWPGIRVHRVRELPRAHLAQRGPILVTTPARTLVDLAPHLNPVLLARVLDEGAIARQWTIAGIMSVVEAVGARPGLSHLRSALAGRRGSEKADSRLELRAQSVLRPLGFEPSTRCRSAVASWFSTWPGPTSNWPSSATAGASAAGRAANSTRTAGRGTFWRRTAGR